MNYYVIKHIPSNTYFPLSDRGGKRGSTHINLPFNGLPRLFKSANAAKTTMNWWLGGPAVTEYDNDGEGRYAVGASIGRGKSDRVASDLEIIKIKIKEIK